MYTNKNMYCKKCDEQFFRSYTFAVHRSKCMGTPRPLVFCSICNKEFKSNSSMYRHKKDCITNKEKTLPLSPPSPPTCSSSSSLSLTPPPILAPSLQTSPLNTTFPSDPNEALQNGRKLWENLKDDLAKLLSGKNYLKRAFVYGLINQSHAEAEAGIFYIGKSIDNRPHDHFLRALTARNDFGLLTTNYKVNRNEKECDTITQIWRIWESGNGVGIAQGLSNITKTEATAMEACIISDLKNHVTNTQRGIIPKIANFWNLRDIHDVAQYGLSKLFSGKKLNLNDLLKDTSDRINLQKIYSYPIVTYNELRRNLIKNTGPVRIQYTSNEQYKRLKKILGLMKESKSGVVDTKLHRILAFYYKERRVYLAPNVNWKIYDVSWK